MKTTDMTLLGALTRMIRIFDGRFVLLGVYRELEACRRKARGDELDGINNEAQENFLVI